jgi:hydrogenase maturation protease
LNIEFYILSFQLNTNSEFNIQSSKLVGGRVLVVGVGNVLHGDDGFGVEVAQRLAQRTDLPPGVTVLEVGIGGMAMVQELFTGYSALIVVDAVDRGGAPGTTYLLEAEVPEISELPFEQRQDALSDMHLATPSRAFVLARALGVLPSLVYIFGCQPYSIEEMTIGLSEPVQRAVEPGVERLVGEVYRLTGTDRGATASIGVE